MIPGSASPFFLGSSLAVGGGAGYQIERSLRFNSSDSVYLSRTFGTATNQIKWTWAGWVKRTAFNYVPCLFTRGSTNTAGIVFSNSSFSSGDSILVGFGNASDNQWVTTTAVFRDPSAWFHLVVSADTANATAANRCKIWINNVEQAISGTISQNRASWINENALHNIGSNEGAPTNSAYVFNGYLADIHFIDGQALTPSSFTEVSATTGQLIPKAYSGTYGTNGFYLQFADNSAATAAALGNDYSGNNNDWTPNNLSVTAGAGNDSLVDTPTSYGTDTGVGGEVRGNYATWNAVNKSANTTLSNGNLNATSAVADWRAVLGTIGMSSGKWYWEITITGASYHLHGIAKQGANLDAFIGTDANGWGYYASSGTYHNSSHINTGVFASYTTNDVIGVAFDADNGSLYFYKNGTVQNSGNAAYTALTSGPYFPAVSHFNSTNSDVNFGQRAFAYQTPGTNRPAATFLALCDTNLPAPLTAKPSTVFDVITYTGTGSSLTLPNGSSTPTSISFTPDFAWLKGRSGATDHALYDAVRGVQKDLVSNSTSAETTETTGLTAFGTNTFTVGSLAKLNTSSSTYVAWAWNAGGSTVSNTSGSITSQVRANVSAGFSVSTWTGTGAVGTIGHGLGVAPGMIIVKARTASEVWYVYHSSLGLSQRIQLNETSAAVGSVVWNSTSPTSTVFSITNGSPNTSSVTYVTYCFAPVVGYSSFGSYTGNGSTDGPFVYTGFRPRWILLKASSATGAWILHDTARTTYNVMGNELRPDDSTAEYAVDRFDLLSNGFKVRSSNATLNTSSATYIYIAFAENPFQYARAR